jgi:hypothetical protein
VSKRKRFVEGCWYGLLYAIFMYFMELHFEGQLGKYYMINLITIPFLTGWWFTSKWIGKLYDKD